MATVLSQLELMKDNVLHEAGTQTGVTAGDVIMSKLIFVKSGYATKVSDGSPVSLSFSPQANGAGCQVTIGSGPANESIYMMLTGQGS